MLWAQQADQVNATQLGWWLISLAAVLAAIYSGVGIAVGIRKLYERKPAGEEAVPKCELDKVEQYMHESFHQVNNNFNQLILKVAVLAEKIEGTHSRSERILSILERNIKSIKDTGELP